MTHVQQPNNSPFCTCVDWRGTWGDDSGGSGHRWCHDSGYLGPGNTRFFLYKWPKQANKPFHIVILFYLVDHWNLHRWRCSHLNQTCWCLLRFLTAVVVLQVFVWIGNEAQEEEKSEAMTSGEAHYISHSWVTHVTDSGVRKIPRYAMWIATPLTLWLIIQLFTSKHIIYYR